MNLCVASTVDHSQKSLTSIPTSISNDCTNLDLSHNPIDDIGEGFLQSNQQLNTIKCDSCFECSCFKPELHKWITRVTTTVITTSLSCRDGTNLQDIEHTLCSGMIIMALEVVVAVNATVVIILILVKKLKQRQENSDDVNELVSTRNTVSLIIEN
ncbi:unnamed protein product [Mytilus coruscus]|uniref:Uncharacterized protein n=1 Tax=Mytilus coruscus TaxID=42192 RepID=A0A6J8AJR8_MYTCO|nr:unnamed protein product [Mytilus coruscus]